MKKLSHQMRPHNITSEGMKIQIIVPWFVEQTIEVGGNLVDNAPCMACWYFYLIGEDTCQKVGSGYVSEHQILTYDINASIAEMPQWMDKRYYAQAESVSRMYGVSIEEMFAYWPQVTLEAAALGMPHPRFEYMNPKQKDHVT